MPGKHNAGGCGCCGTECLEACMPSAINFASTDNTGCCSYLLGDWLVNPETCQLQTGVNPSIAIKLDGSEANGECLECFLAETTITDNLRITGSECVDVCYSQFDEACETTIFTLKLIVIDVTFALAGSTRQITVRVTYEYDELNYKAILGTCQQNYFGNTEFWDEYYVELDDADCADLEGIDVPYSQSSVGRPTSLTSHGTIPFSYTLCDRPTVSLKA